MSPHFLFRIDEVCENPHAPAEYDMNGIWRPSTELGGNERMNGSGATGMWWYCNGQGIQRLNVNAPPHGSSYFQTFSVFYCDGFGFWVLRGDAINPPAADVWHPLSFDWEDDYSAYLTNAGQNHTLRVQRSDQTWPQMLLPSTNQVPPIRTHLAYGGLKGDLAIFLALIAMSMDRPNVPYMLPRMFSQGAWAHHPGPHGRFNQRGVVVYVRTVPSSWDSSSSAKELERYQEGDYGKYYY